MNDDMQKQKNAAGAREAPESTTEQIRAQLRALAVRAIQTASNLYDAADTKWLGDAGALHALAQEQIRAACDALTEARLQGPTETDAKLTWLRNRVCELEVLAKNMHAREERTRAALGSGPDEFTDDAARRVAAAAHPSIAGPLGSLALRLLAAWSASGLSLGKLLVAAANEGATGGAMSLSGMTSDAIVEMLERYVAANAARGEGQ